MVRSLMQALGELDFLLNGSCLLSLCNWMVHGAVLICLSHFPAMMATRRSRAVLVVCHSILLGQITAGTDRSSNSFA